MIDLSVALMPDIERLVKALGYSPAFWWRDDDLAGMTPQLQQLSDFAVKHQVPCLLSAISARFAAAPSEWDQFGEQLHYACHGLHHKNHQWLSLFPSEFGSSRSRHDVATDLASAWSHVSAAFGPRALPILVPPWNRFDRKHYLALAQSDFLGFSGFARGAARGWPPSVKRVDVHLDIIDWRTNPVVLEREIIVSRLRKLMRRLTRISQKSSRSEVIGVLTHHRVMDDSAWQLLTDLFKAFVEGGMPAAHPRLLFELQLSA